MLARRHEYRIPVVPRTRHAAGSTPTLLAVPDPAPPLPIMSEWDTGLGWLLAILVAAFHRRPADTQHARPTGPPPDDRFTDEAPTRLPVRPGWPPGIPSPARAVRSRGCCPPIPADRSRNDGPPEGVARSWTLTRYSPAGSLSAR
jgi:hypothetical protein